MEPMAKAKVRPDENAYKAAQEYSDKVGEFLNLNDTAHKKVLEQYRSIQAQRFERADSKDTDKGR
jgi:hypothetical protein